MKVLNLWVSIEGWKAFEYEVLSDLAEEFKIRNIYISYSANIGDSANIGKSAYIVDYAKPIIINVNGSKHFVSYWGQNRIDIGCHSKSISEWDEIYAEVGKSENYTDQQISEYKKYIDFISDIHNKSL